MTALVYIDSRAAFASAHQRGTIATDISPLAALPELAGRVVDMDRLLSSEKVNALGDTAIRLSLAVDDLLRGSDLPERVGLLTDFCQTGGGFSRLTAGLLHRASAMSHMLARGSFSAIELFTIGQDWFQPSTPLVAARFGSPFPALGAAGFFGSLAVRTRVIEPPAVNAPPAAVAKGMRRVLYLPTSLLLYEVLDRLRVVPRGRGQKGTLVVGHENEALREALPWLALNGFAIQRIGNRFSRSEPTHTTDERWLQPLTELVSPAILRAVGAHAEFDDAARNAISTLLMRQLAVGLPAVASAIPAWRDRIASQWKGVDPKIYLTGGLFGLAGAQLFGLLREACVHVVDFEHGFTTGLSEHSQRKIAYSEASTADTVILSNENAVRAFGSARRGSEVKRIAAGLSTQSAKMLRRPLQRRAARRALGLKGSLPVIFHVSTWLHSGNMRPGFGTPSESFVVDAERALIEKCYAGLDKTVVFKRYPTFRFPDEPTLSDRVELPRNVMISPDEDLRYLRAAADLFVTASPTSTLGWIVGAGVPIIWLASRKVNPVVEQWDHIVREAYLTVDVDSPDWPDALNRLLSEPMSDLNCRWAEKAEVRARLHRDAIVGPDSRSGRRAAAAIADLVRGRRAPERHDLADPVSSTR